MNGTIRDTCWNDFDKLRYFVVRFSIVKGGLILRYLFSSSKKGPFEPWNHVLKFWRDSYESRQKVGILKWSLFGKIEVPFWRTKIKLQKKSLPTRVYLKKKGTYFFSLVKRSLFAKKGTFLNNKIKQIGTFFWKRDPGGSLFLFQKGTFEYKKWDLYIFRKFTFLLCKKS